MVTAERLLSLLDYEPTTGVFRWREKRGQRSANSVAGGPTGNGYWKISIDHRDYLAHRLAWLYVYGIWPGEDLDHINEIKFDNRIANLRLATSSQNKQNITKLLRSNTSGFRGVYWANGAWVGQIKLNRQRIHLGRFDTPEAASAAYVAARGRLHPFAPRRS